MGVKCDTINNTYSRATLCVVALEWVTSSLDFSLIPSPNGHIHHSTTFIRMHSTREPENLHFSEESKK